MRILYIGASRHSLYLLYSYKTTNTDAADAQVTSVKAALLLLLLYSCFTYALLVDTDAADAQATSLKAASIRTHLLYEKLVFFLLLKT